VTNPLLAGKSFAHQAAQFSLAAPFVALLLGFCLTPALDRAGAEGTINVMSVRWALFGLNILLLVSSFVLGIYALTAIRKLGTKGLLVRSIVGVAASGIILFFIAGLFFAEPPAIRVAKRVTGTWVSKVSHPGTGWAHVRMELLPRGSARWQLTDGPAPMDLGGKWKILRQKDSPLLVLQIQFDKPPADAPQLTALAWAIEHVEESRLDLFTRDASGKRVLEIYTRAP
jgi:hypothetical protein